MKTTISRLSALTLAVAAFAAPAHAAPTNLLVNGGFESTVLTKGWDNFSSIAGWTWVSGPGTGFEVRKTVGTAHEGLNFIELDTTGNTRISQTVVGLTEGAAYDLSFWYSPRIQQGADTNGIQVFWNNVQLGGDITGLGASANIWSEHDFKVTAQAGVNVLSFASVGNSDQLGGNLDNVFLSASAVPEPMSVSLMAIGLVALSLSRRRLGR